MEVTHQPNGKFAPGNKLGGGNPHIKKVHLLRKALYDAVTENDVYAIVTKLIDQAKEGDVASAREVLDRTIGKAIGNDNLNITTDTEAANPFRDYLDRNPALARETAVLIRRMASDAGNVGVDGEQSEMAVAGSPGTALEQTARSGDHAE